MAVSALESLEEMLSAYLGTRVEGREEKRLERRAKTHSVKSRRLNERRGDLMLDCLTAEAEIFSPSRKLPPVSGNPLLMSSIKGAGDSMDVEESYEAKKARMLQELNSSARVRFQEPADMIEYIKGCESYYNRTTKDHLDIYASRGYEGNADDARWYRFATYLLRMGYSLDDISGSRE